MRNYKLVGLTGGTGSGKSIVREVFSENGYRIIDADTLARKAVESRIVIGSILSEFGDDLMTADGLNRRELANRAFKDSESVKKLNNITHPRITQLFIEELKSLVDLGEKKILFDAPQLFEAGLVIVCDCTVAVLADYELRLERIIKRDSISASEAEKRLKIQFPDSFFRENCDFYIENNNSEKELKKKASELVSRI